jgi:hypothetical protein
MGKYVKFFWQQQCSRCPPAKVVCHEVADELGVDVEYWNIKDRDGLAEASFYGVMSTPTTIIVSEDEEEVFSWTASVPSKEEMVRQLMDGSAYGDQGIH